MESLAYLVDGIFISLERHSRMSGSGLWDACCTVRRAGKSGLCFLMQDSNAAEYGRGGDSKAREDEEKEDK